MRRRRLDIEQRERLTLSRYELVVAFTKARIHLHFKLEQTVTKLQTALGCSPEDVAALPPPLAKIRELEQENARLLKENDELRRLLGDSRGLPVEMGRRSNGGGFIDVRNNCDRDFKRRKMSDEIYSMVGVQLVGVDTSRCCRC